MSTDEEEEKEDDVDVVERPKAVCSISLTCFKFYTLCDFSLYFL